MLTGLKMFTNSIETIRILNSRFALLTDVARKRDVIF